MAEKHQKKAEVVVHHLVIFVHGLLGNPWDFDNLRDKLDRPSNTNPNTPRPRRTPKTTFFAVDGYSGVIEPNGGVEYASNIAFEQICNRIDLQRHDKKMPFTHISFIGHSFGGIVIRRVVKMMADTNRLLVDENNTQTCGEALKPCVITTISSPHLGSARPVYRFLTHPWQNFTHPLNPIASVAADPGCFISGREMVLKDHHGLHPVTAGYIFIRNRCIPFLRALGFNDNWRRWEFNDGREEPILLEMASDEWLEPLQYFHWNVYASPMDQSVPITTALFPGIEAQHEEQRFRHTPEIRQALLRMTRQLNNALGACIRNRELFTEVRPRMWVILTLSVLAQLSACYYLQDSWRDVPLCPVTLMFFVIVVCIHAVLYPVIIVMLPLLFLGFPQVLLFSAYLCYLELAIIYALFPHIRVVQWNPILGFGLRFSSFFSLALVTLSYGLYCCGYVLFPCLFVPPLLLSMLLAPGDSCTTRIAHDFEDCVRRRIGNDRQE